MVAGSGSLLVVLLMIGAVWLATYADGRRRLPSTHDQRGPGNRTYSQHTRLPVDNHTLRSLLQTEGLLGLTKQTVDQRHTVAGVPVVALCKVKAGQAYHPFTVWDHEEAVLWEYLGHPLDAFSFQLLDIRMCDEQIKVFRTKAGSAASLKQPVFTPAVDMVSGTIGGQQVATILQEWGVANTDIEVMQVCEPLVQLICKRKWSHIMSLARYEGPFIEGLPPEDSPVLMLKGKHLT